MTAMRICPTPNGDVLLGDFKEVLRIPGKHLNDHCLIHAHGLWHFFGIIGDVAPDGGGFGGAVLDISFAHATSQDLCTWELHPEVMLRSGTWPENCGAIAPYVIEHESKFYMLYGSVDNQTLQRICLATSSDLFTWTRYAGNPIITPSLSWTRWPGFGATERDDYPDPRYNGSLGGCRDPHVLRLPDGRFVAYWVSRMQEKFGRNLTCVAASISHDLVHWQEIGPVFSIAAWHDPPSREAESPCVVNKDGRYWLFFKHGWWTYFVCSDSPFDFHGLPAIRLGFAHAAEVFHWNDQWWITHCSGDPSDYAYRRTNRTRGLFLGKLDWPEGSAPRFARDPATEKI